MVSILNERKYAEDMLQNGFLDKRRGQSIFILAKYYRFHDELSKAETKKKLDEFCQKYVRNFKSSDMCLNIRRAVDNAYKDKVFLLELDYLNISQTEIDYIQSRENLDAESKKLLFVILCLVKISQAAITRDTENYWTMADKNFQYLRKVGNFGYKFNVYDSLHKLYELGYIKVSDYKQTINALFMEKIEQDNNILILEDFTTIGYWWDKNVCQDKWVMTCVCCSKLIKRKSNRQLMCEQCGIEVHKNNVLEQYYNNKIK